MGSEMCIRDRMGCAPVLGPSYVVWSSVAEAALAGQLHEAQNRAAVIARTSRRLQDSFTTIVGTSCSVWLPANALSYAFVPQHYRIAFNTAVACCYNAFLTWIAHR